MYSVSHVFSRKAKLSKLILCGWMISFFVSGPGYAMQPPPSPLNIAQLKKLISEANIIAVGEIARVRETEGIDGRERNKSIEVTLRIEKLLKGEVLGKTIVIKETYPTFDSLTLGPRPKDEDKPEKTIIGLRAGPRSYHGRYKQGTRIIVLLAKTEGTDEYKPLGSGTFDKHLCEFLIEDDGIKVFYFKFADDVGKHVGSEEQFIRLIKSLGEGE